MRHIVIIFVSIGLLNFGFYGATTFADTTEVLRPVADGGDDSANWTNTAGIACDTADCHLEVDESSGSACTNSDGNTSYIQSSTNGASQTLDISLSDILTGSLISQIDIMVCYAKSVSGPGNDFVTRKCVDGSCTDHSDAISIEETAYAETTQSHSGLNITKSSSTDIEIGATLGGSRDNPTRISQISAVITYTIPSTPTPTPTPGGGGGGGGGGNSPAKIIFSGYAFLGAKLGVYLLGEAYGQVLIDGEFSSDEKGFFSKEIISPAQEKRLYALILKDRNGNFSKSKFFTYDLKFNQVIEQKNIIFPPTMSVSKTRVTRNELLLVSGYASPESKVELAMNEKVISEETAEQDGRYRIFIDTNTLELGEHKLRVRQKGDGGDGDFSEIKTVKVAAVSFLPIDFNKDGKIDVRDWSVFLHRWSSEDEELKKEADLSGDGKLDISDFSIFLNLFQLGRSR